MKLHFLIAAATISALTLGATAEAQTNAVWVPVYRRSYAESQPGTYGESLYNNGVGGMAVFVDAKSIVRRGNFAYFNSTLTSVNLQGLPTKPLEAGVGKQVDCQTKSTLTSKGTWMPWGDNNLYKLQGEFVCR